MRAGPLPVLAGALLLVASEAAAQERFEHTRIPHRDGSGRGTIVEIAPSVPGARDFVREDDRPPPRRGEISLPSPAPRTSPGADEVGRRRE